MSSHTDWKSTPIGQLAQFIGSVKFAVPSLALSAIAMSWGTYVDSTIGRVAAMDKVYGSWWFIVLMACICASLILSVAVRYPWRRKHVGFIIVHASMISLIAIGFFTMYTKIEGRIVLDEGQSSGGKMLLDDRWIELLEPKGDGYAQIEHVVLDTQAQLSLGGETLEITEFWANSALTRKITNDNTQPLHAVQIITEPGQVEGDWAGQVESSSPAPMLNDFAIRVVATGQVWEPPVTTTEGVRVILADESEIEQPLGNVGETFAESGWVLTEVEHFERALIGAGGAISERDSGPANKATRIVLTHTDGSVEQQVAFEKMRESPFPKLLEGETASGLMLTYRGETFTQPTLAVMRTEEGMITAIYAEPGGTIASYRHTGEWPWTISVAGKPVTIVQSFDRALASPVLEQRPVLGESNNSPAIVVVSSGGETASLRWNTPTPLKIGDRTLTLRYGEMTMDLPFNLHLLDFRKMDYPGSQMAMAYESDVTVLTGELEPFDFKIHMNHPYKQDGWKVYQSGFLSDSITVFQVTKDPGLVPTYLACITLCLGILITFYSRSLSWGHPDIPMPFDPTAAEKV